MLSAKDRPLTIKVAVVIGLGFGIPLIAIGLVPLGLGALTLLDSQGPAEAGFYGAGFVLVGGVYIAA